MKKLLFALLKIVLLLCLIVAAIGYVWLMPPKPPVLQAFINGHVLTLNEANDTAQAVLLEREKIVAIGTTKEISALIQAHPERKHVRVHDLAGNTLMPGFIDAHSHFPASGVYEFAADLNAPPIGNIGSIEELLSVLRKREAQLKDAHDWLFGFGYDDTQMVDGRHPLKEELDRVSSERPIFILHVSGHIGVANSAALQRLGVDKNTRPPDGGQYQKNAEGELTGLILENAIFAFQDKATDFSLPEIVQIVKAASNEYASQGVTMAQNGAADWRNISGLKWAAKLGAIKQRLILWPRHGALTPDKLTSLKQDNSDKYEIGAIKLVADGSIQGYTAYLKQPYHTVPDEYGDEFAGHPLMSRETLAALVTDYFKQRQQLAIHGNGDAAIDDILYAVEQAQTAYPRADPRVVLIHAQMASKKQLEKMKKLGVTPSFFSAHTYYWADRHRNIFLGPERVMQISPANSASKLDLPFTIHLDSPVVPMQSMRLLWSAVQRESSAGQSIGRTERISREQALKAVTIDAAYQVFREHELGSIEVGKLADLVVLDADPSNDDTDLLNTKVLSTFVGGVLIYSFE